VSLGVDSDVMKLWIPMFVQDTFIMRMMQECNLDFPFSALIRAFYCQQLQSKTFQLQKEFAGIVVRGVSSASGPTWGIASLRQTTDFYPGYTALQINV
jgi:hypothetical protein